jgi:hypothetical protein
VIKLVEVAAKKEFLDTYGSQESDVANKTCSHIISDPIEVEAEAGEDSSVVFLPLSNSVVLDGRLDILGHT